MMSPVFRERRPELRRHSRARVTWPVIVEAGNRLYHLQTENLSPFGAKVRMDEPLEVGSPVRLRLEPPEGRPLDVEAIVWRRDSDGPAFFFIGVHAGGYSLPTDPSSNPPAA
jgi:hypothetical protein